MNEHDCILIFPSFFLCVYRSHTHAVSDVLSSLHLFSRFSPSDIYLHNSNCILHFSLRSYVHSAHSWPCVFIRMHLLSWLRKSDITPKLYLPETWERTTHWVVCGFGVTANDANQIDRSDGCRKLISVKMSEDNRAEWRTFAILTNNCSHALCATHKTLTIRFADVIEHLHTFAQRLFGSQKKCGASNLNSQFIDIVLFANSLTFSFCTPNSLYNWSNIFRARERKMCKACIQPWNNSTQHDNVNHCFVRTSKIFKMAI